MSACASGAEAIVQAAEMIRPGRPMCDRRRRGFAAVNDLVISGFSQIRALSTRNEDPSRASRPSTRARDGFVLAEGAGDRGAGDAKPRPGPRGRVLGFVAGGSAVTSDANDIVAR